MGYRVCLWGKLRVYEWGIVYMNGVIV